ncbi:hypothetical protein [Sinorhizobium sp. CB7]|uniref:hypothetical protein n=1 Tax=Sinorhizobium sp. CB7 TaxID=3056949 RepID=UPI0035236ABE
MVSILHPGRKQKFFEPAMPLNPYRRRQKHKPENRRMSNGLCRLRQKSTSGPSVFMGFFPNVSADDPDIRYGHKRR